MTRSTLTPRLSPRRRRWPKWVFPCSPSSSTAVRRPGDSRAGRRRRGNRVQEVDWRPRSRTSLPIGHTIRSRFALPRLCLRRCECSGVIQRLLIQTRRRRRKTTARETHDPGGVIPFYPGGFVGICIAWSRTLEAGRQTAQARGADGRSRARRARRHELPGRPSRGATLSRFDRNAGIVRPNVAPTSSPSSSNR